MAIRFGVIFIVDFLRAINDKNKQLRSILECKKIHFIFDVGNPLLKESSQLIVEVPMIDD
ncbi:hypothetical protein C2R76_08770 [Helicobacter pylori]|uniref:hypothetical protein n=1 Tax=Helicobacter pylori TaxID=210 RepID=UPI000D348B67|nr:hypothetical protein [Helicobacter pylori]PUD65291.1 hypothetical protein C2R76_08770 [Helicobacter pylori]